MSKIDRYKAYAAQLVRDPDNHTALVDQFAIISVKKEHARLYIPLAKRAYDLAPDKISPVFNYASALHRVGEFERALEIYKRCLNLADAEWMPKVLHHVGIGYRALNNNLKAAEYYLKAYDLNPNPQYLKDRSIALLAAGRLREGLE